MKTEIPNWVTEYNNAGHQSSAARAIKILMTRISELEHGWISVKDKLPDDTEDVLWCKVPIIEPYYFGSMADSYFVHDYYTHWMSLSFLPNPPQK